MANEYRAHAHAGMDRAGAAAQAPTGPREEGSLTIGELARRRRTLRALRFCQSKGLLTPRRNGAARLFSHDDRERLALILQGKRLGFTLTELREMLAARVRGCNKTLPIDRRKCVEQINMLERQRRDIDGALAELRQIYTEMFVCLRFFCGIQGHGLGEDVIAITISGVPYPLT
jgi:DNA-binding transcriptional MerR regulator